MVYSIRLYGDPVLRRRVKEMRTFDGLPEVAERMTETMLEAGGVGLAGPQVGLSRRLFVMAEYVEEEESEDDERSASKVKELYVMVNPRLVWREGSQVGTEGCLSIPGLFSDQMSRSLRVRVAYQDQYGESKTMEAEGYLARVIQHECDHLDGILFMDRLPPADRADFFEANRAELIEMQQRSKAFLRELKARA